MEVIITEDKQYYTLKISGDLDASSSIILDNALEKALKETDKTILIDCHELDYISSPGIGVFTSRVGDDTSPIVLYGMSEKVFNVFKILGLDQLLPIFKDKKDVNLEPNGRKNQG